MHSEETKELIAALIKAQSEFEEPKKTSQGYGYKYADLSEVIGATKQCLIKNGLTVIQQPVGSDGDIGVETTLFHISGQYIKEMFTMPLSKVGPQQIGSVITYFRRYSYMAVLGLAPEDTDAADVKVDPKEIQIIDKLKTALSDCNDFARLDKIRDRWKETGGDKLHEGLELIKKKGEQLK